VSSQATLWVLEQDERAEQLHSGGVELGLPAGERRAEVEVACPGGDSLLVLALPLLAAGLSVGDAVAERCDDP
jgi:hypothetical protein